MLTASGAALLRPDRPSPIVLRLLPQVHRPPARVLVAGGSGQEARALDARGYAVTLVSVDGAALDEIDGQRIGVMAADLSSADFGGVFDLVATADGLEGASIEGAARALRAGGQLFGAFSGADAGALIRATEPWFDVVKLESSGYGSGVLEAVFVRR